MSDLSRDAAGIAVIGMAGAFPGAKNVDEFWRSLTTGREAISRVCPTPGDSCGAPDHVCAVGRVDDIDLFDAEFFRVPPAEAAVTDPQHRLLLEIAMTAMEDAGYGNTRGLSAGVFVGCGENQYSRRIPDAQCAGSDELRTIIGNEKDFAAARIAFKLGLSGPSLAVQATCATSLTAIALACSALQAGDCDIALAGGVSLLMPETHGYTYYAGGIFSPDGRCRAFDSAAAGTVPGSGVGVVVLKRDNDARADHDNRRAVVRGWAINNDGGTGAGFTAPSVKGQESVIRAALKRAGIAPREVVYVETHGTGTLLGDPIEVEALRRVYGVERSDQEPCVLGAVKPNIGHADAAAGVAGFIKAIFSLESGHVPPTLHFTELNPGIDLRSAPLVVSADTVPLPDGAPRIAGVSAFGLGGNNAHVIIEGVDPVGPTTERPRNVLLLSARSSAELLDMRARLAAWFDSFSAQDDLPLSDACFTLAVGRTAYPYRWATGFNTRADATSALYAPATDAPKYAQNIRLTLSVHADRTSLESIGQRNAARDERFRQEYGLLAAQLATSAASDAAPISALAAIRTLRGYGLSFARVTVPEWLHALLDWDADGAEPHKLRDALDACHGDAPSLADPAGPGRLVIGPDFDVADTLASAWVQGARVSWDAYYADPDRRRIRLPTYPFRRARHWLELPDVSSAGTAAAETNRLGGHGYTTIANAVEEVWREVLGVEAIPHDAHFANDLSGDSMYAVEIGARLKELFDCPIPIDAPFAEPTIEKLAAFIQRAMTGSEHA